MRALQQAWYEHIPLSEKMGVRIHNIPGKNLSPPCRKPVIRIRTYAVCREFILTGNAHRLGAYWLMLRERHLGGTIILADAHIATASRLAVNLMR